MPTRPPVYRNRFAPPPGKDLRGSAASRGYDRAWREKREQVLRERPICVFANDTDLPHVCGIAASVVDHIVPLPQGERLDDENLRPVCRACHQALTTNLTNTGRNEMPRRRGAARQS